MATTTSATLHTHAPRPRFAAATEAPGEDGAEDGAEGVVVGALIARWLASVTPVCNRSPASSRNAASRRSRAAASLCALTSRSPGSDVAIVYPSYALIAAK